MVDSTAVWLYHGVWMSKSKNQLGKVDLAAIDPPKAKRKKRKHVPVASPGGKTRMAREVRTRQREAMPPTAGLGLIELQDIDPDDPRLKIKGGRPRKREGVDEDDLDWEDLIRKQRQDRARERRADVRKYEAEIVEATNVMTKHSTRAEQKMEVFDEEVAIAQGLLSLDDWDDEELIRGYRRTRSGKFGKPPRFIPREVQQQAFRVLASRGTNKLQGVLLESIEQLVDLVRNADSEKVRLEAIKEVMNRVVGKTPDIVLSGSAKPWEEALMDAIVPLSSAPPLELEMGDDGIAVLPYVPVGPEEDEQALMRDDGVDAPDSGGLAASPTPDTGASEAPPSSRSQKSGVKKKKKKKKTPKEPK